MKSKGQQILIETKRQYQDHVYKQAIYLSPYKMSKIMHDFDVEWKFLQQHLERVSHDGNDANHCTKYVNAINMILANAAQSFQLIIAEAGIYNPFNVTATPDAKYADVTSRYEECIERAISLLPKGSKEREINQAKMESKKIDISAANVDQVLKQLLDDIRQVNFS